MFYSNFLAGLVLAFSCSSIGEAPKVEVRPAGIWFGVAKPALKATGAIRLATYNVENLFDDKDDPTLSGQFDDINEKTNSERLMALAETIKLLDADVLCLEEVESKECLEWFRDKYLAGLGYEHVASLDVGYYRGVEQAVLSRIPIISASIYKGSDSVISDMEPRRTEALAKDLGGSWAPSDGKPIPECFQRSPLRVVVRTSGGYELTLFVLHLKAGAFDHQRELEALQVEEFSSEMLKANPDSNFAIVGDFNSTPNSMAVRVLRMSPYQLASAYDWRMDRTAPPAVYTTHASNRALDYIILSPGLAADCVANSYFVLGTLHAASDWDYKKAKEIPPPDGYASDHYPVSIDFFPVPDRSAKDFRPQDSSGAASVITKAPLQPVQDPPVAAEKPQANQSSLSVALRTLKMAKASEEDIKLATQLVEAGWNYVMPTPKSAKATWSSHDKRTTWWTGYWENSTSKKTSLTKPTEETKFSGDDAGGKTWKAGGAPDRPTMIEWLCSKSGGIEPN